MPETPLEYSAALSPTEVKPRRLRKWLIRAFVAFVVLAVVGLVGLEIYARMVYQLGDPPLYADDAELEYILKPNQTCHRFGNTIHYNQYSMRSKDFPIRKSEPNELRIMMIGDSVINGGSQTDQLQLSSTRLEITLREYFSRPVTVGNIGASSWGPPNMLAYLKRHGLFDADFLVIVLSSHDYGDAPTFEKVVGVNGAFPERKPLLAIQELWNRTRIVTSNEGFKRSDPTTEEIKQCMDAITEMIRMGKKQGAHVMVVQHLERDELLTGKMLTGHDMIRDLAQREGAEVLQLSAAFQKVMDLKREPYRDFIHPNQLGQLRLGEILFDAISDQLERKGL